MPIALVAEMTGTSPEMVSKVYSLNSEKNTPFVKAVNKVRSG